MLSPIYKLSKEWIPNCNLFIKREDLIPFSFGGNKARKAKYFFEEIIKENITSVVTYGSSSSNHCRVISNLCVKNGIKCYIVTPNQQKKTYNTMLCSISEANYVYSEISKVSITIDDTINSLNKMGENVYFIPGGGHGNLGTEAYVECYNEIISFENENDIEFDKIVLASGTGTTQAGLICGAYINNDDLSRIIGISIARKKDYATNVIKDSVVSYLNKDFHNNINLIDKYIGEGYGYFNEDMITLLKEVYKYEGIPLDLTYTGKAFYGMQDIYKENKKNENILFIHTGGTPLFFDSLEEIK